MSNFRDFLQREARKFFQTKDSIYTQKQTGQPKPIDVVTFTNQERSSGVLTDGTSVKTTAVGRPQQTDVGYLQPDGSYMVQRNPVKCLYSGGAVQNHYIILQSSSGGGDYGWYIKKLSDTTAYRIPFESLSGGSYNNHVLFDKTGTHAILIKCSTVYQNPYNTDYLGLNRCDSLPKTNPVWQDDTEQVYYTVFPNFFLNSSTGLLDSKNKIQGTFTFDLSTYTPSGNTYSYPLTVGNTGQSRTHPQALLDMVLFEFVASGSSYLLNCQIQARGVLQVEYQSSQNVPYNPLNACWQTDTTGHRWYVAYEQWDITSTPVMKTHIQTDSSVFLSLIGFSESQYDSWYASSAQSFLYYAHGGSCTYAFNTNKNQSAIPYYFRTFFIKNENGSLQTSLINSIDSFNTANFNQFIRNTDNNFYFCVGDSATSFINFNPNTGSGFEPVTVSYDGITLNQLTTGQSDGIYDNIPSSITQYIVDKDTNGNLILDSSGGLTWKYQKDLTNKTPTNIQGLVYKKRTIKGPNASLSGLYLDVW